MRLEWHPGLNNPNSFAYRIPEIGAKFWMFKWDMSPQHIKSFLSPREVTVIEHKKENKWYTEVVTSIIVLDEFGNEHTIGCFNTFDDRNFKESWNNSAYGFTRQDECAHLYNKYREAELRRIKRAMKNLKIMIDTLEEE